MHFTTCLLWRLFGLIKFTTRVFSQPIIIPPTRSTPVHWISGQWNRHAVQPLRSLANRSFVVLRGKRLANVGDDLGSREFPSGRESVTWQTVQTSGVAQIDSAIKEKRLERAHDKSSPFREGLRLSHARAICRCSVRHDSLCHTARGAYASTSRRSVLSCPWDHSAKRVTV